MANAIVTCRLCAKSFDKGVPAQEGQNDETFVCEPCAEERGGYPQNGWRNPLVLGPKSIVKAGVQKKSLLKRILGR